MPIYTPIQQPTPRDPLLHTSLGNPRQDAIDEAFAQMMRDNESMADRSLMMSTLVDRDQYTREYVREASLREFAESLLSHGRWGELRGILPGVYDAIVGAERHPRELGMSSDQMKWLMKAASANNARDFEIAMHRTRMTPEEMIQKFMEMNRFASRQSVAQSLPGRALGAIAQGTASVAARAGGATARATPVVARALSSAGARALSSAGGVGLRAASAGARALSSVGSAAKRALSARGRRSPDEAQSQLPDSVLGELRERSIDPGAVAKAMAGPRRRRGIDLEDARARVMRQAMAT